LCACLRKLNFITLNVRDVVGLHEVRFK
jgi:hypothetical protein